MHNITIDDDNGNWVRWGALVESWINSPNRPTTVEALRVAMAQARVAGTVQGAPDRGVTFWDYGTPTDPIGIPLPAQAMIDHDKRLLDAIALRPPGQRHYPLPGFYAVVFGGAHKVDLGKAELEAMMLRRLGEYVINECM